MSNDLRLPLLQDPRRRATGDDRRRGRAHGGLHGHQPRHARSRTGDPARALARPAGQSSRMICRAVAVAAQRLAGRMTEKLGADGVNVINSCGAVAWQTVFHFHVHVIPRYATDPLRLPWTPAPGDPEQIARPRRSSSRNSGCSIGGMTAWASNLFDVEPLPGPLLRVHSPYETATSIPGPRGWACILDPGARPPAHCATLAEVGVLPPTTPETPATPPSCPGTPAWR